MTRSYSLPTPDSPPMVDKINKVNRIKHGWTAREDILLLKKAIHSPGKMKELSL